MQIGKEVKLSLLTEDVTLYREKYKYSTKKTVNNIFSKVAKYENQETKIS